VLVFFFLKDTAPTEISPLPLHDALPIWRDREAARAAGRARWLVGVLLLGWAGMLGACRDPSTASGTALYVTAEFDSALLLTQLEVAGSVQGGPPVGPSRLPEAPDRFLRSGETFRVLLPLAEEGTRAELRVRGLRAGQPVASGTGSVQVRAGYEVDVTVRLLPPSSEPDAGFCPDCAGGCCLSGFCTAPSFNTCGTGGVACVRCDINTANTCLPQGVCGCGTDPACTWPQVDRCGAQGQCQCGAGAACGPGQQCMGGQCRCTPDSCVGCCEGNVCKPGGERRECGRGGQACRRCDKRCNADGTCD